MKRFFSLLSLLLLGASVLVACGSDATATSAPPTRLITTNLTSGPSDTTVAASLTTASATTASTTTASVMTVAANTTLAPKVTPSVASNSPTASSGVGLPIYSGLKAISLGGFEQQLAQGLTGQAGTNARYKAFSTAEVSAKVFTFYDDEMKKIGFNKGPETEIPSQPGINLKGKIATYQKGTGSVASGAAIVFLGPLDDTLIALLTVGAPDATKQLKAGNSLVILFNDLSGPALQVP